jgi:hypothetical protein
MHRSQAGIWGTAALAGLNVLLWLIFPPESNRWERFVQQMVSAIFSSTGMVLGMCAGFSATVAGAGTVLRRAR